MEVLVVVSIHESAIPCIGFAGYSARCSREGALLMNKRGSTSARHQGWWIPFASAGFGNAARAYTAEEPSSPSLPAAANHHERFMM